MKIEDLTEVKGLAARRVQYIEWLEEIKKGSANTTISIAINERWIGDSEPFKAAIFDSIIDVVDGIELRMIHLGVSIPVRITEQYAKGEVS